MKPSSKSKSSILYHHSDIWDTSKPKGSENLKYKAAANLISGVQEFMLLLISTDLQKLKLDEYWKVVGYDRRKVFGYDRRKVVRYDRRKIVEYDRILTKKLLSTPIYKWATRYQVLFYFTSTGLLKLQVELDLINRGLFVDWGWQQFFC